MRLIVSLLLLVSLQTTAQDLVLKNGHVRIMPPGQNNTAAFLVLKNTSKQDIRLMQVSTPAAKKAEFHTHLKDEKGMMRMRQMPHVDIKANSEFEFKSGGHHIMLMGLTKPLSADSKVKFTLVSSDDKQVSIELPARSLLDEPKSGEPKHMDHSHHHMHH